MRRKKLMKNIYGPVKKNIVDKKRCAVHRPSNNKKRKQDVELKRKLVAVKPKKRPGVELLPRRRHDEKPQPRRRHGVEKPRRNTDAGWLPKNSVGCSNSNTRPRSGTGNNRRRGRSSNRKRKLVVVRVKPRLRNSDDGKRRQHESNNSGQVNRQRTHIISNVPHTNNTTRNSISNPMHNKATITIHSLHNTLNSSSSSSNVHSHKVTISSNSRTSSIRNRLPAPNMRRWRTNQKTKDRQ
mmetsp:Transcript_14827/g.36266  ORF Transcript_14827/g.36266 Transcript_14827/m.36266 type:complete len:239 (-) Transcript_14827:1821-2537(-)